MSDALDHMAPLRALVSTLHNGRSLEERVRVARLKREGMRRATVAVPAEAEDEAIDLSALDESAEAVNTTTTTTEEEA